MPGDLSSSDDDDDEYDPAKRSSTGATTTADGDKKKKEKDKEKKYQWPHGCKITVKFEGLIHILIVSDTTVEKCTKTSFSKSCATKNARS